MKIQKGIYEKTDPPIKILDRCIAITTALIFVLIFIFSKGFI